jgi:hypothetical protein
MGVQRSSLLAAWKFTDNFVAVNTVSCLEYFPAGSHQRPDADRYNSPRPKNSSAIAMLALIVIEAPKLCCRMVSIVRM